MSAMSILYTEIQSELQDGGDPRVIAKTMNIPTEWVYDVLETTLQTELEEECQGF